MEDSKTMLHLNQRKDLTEKLEVKVVVPLSKPTGSLSNLPHEVVVSCIIPYLKPASPIEEEKNSPVLALRETCRQFSGLEGQKIIEQVSEPKTYKYLKITTLPIIKKSLDYYERFAGDDFPGPCLGTTLLLVGVSCGAVVGTLTALVGFIHDGYCYYERYQHQLHNRPKNPHYMDYQYSEVSSSDVEQNNQDIHPVSIHTP